MNLKRVLVQQFHHPAGLPGRIAGWIMSHRDSNLRRNQWTLDLLDLQPEDEVCELGPGPGITLTRLLARCRRVVAVDHSVLMLDQCRRRHARAIADGRLLLYQAEFTNLPDFGQVDKIFAVNALQFDGQNVETLTGIATHLKPGGRIAITFQPRGNAPTDEDVDRAARTITDLLTQAGFIAPVEHRLPLQPVAAVCIIATV